MFMLAMTTVCTVSSCSKDSDEKNTPATKTATSQDVQGSWNVTYLDGAKRTMTLNADGTGKWQYSDTSTEEYPVRWTFENNTITVNHEPSTLSGMVIFTIKDIVMEATGKTYTGVQFTPFDKIENKVTITKVLK